MLILFILLNIQLEVIPLLPQRYIERLESRAPNISLLSQDRNSFKEVPTKQGKFNTLTRTAAMISVLLMIILISIGIHKFTKEIKDEQN